MMNNIIIKMKHVSHNESLSQKCFDYWLLVGGILIVIVIIVSLVIYYVTNKICHPLSEHVNTVDYIIIGSGAAGAAALHAIVKSNHRARVLMLEAGIQAESLNIVPMNIKRDQISPSNILDVNKWPNADMYTNFDVPGQYTTIPCWNSKCDLAWQSTKYVSFQPKCVGGATAINGALVQYPSAKTFDNWNIVKHREDIYDSLAVISNSFKIGSTNTNKPWTSTPSRDLVHYQGGGYDQVVDAMLKGPYRMNLKNFELNPSPSALVKNQAQHPFVSTDAKARRTSPISIFSGCLNINYFPNVELLRGYEVTQLISETSSDMINKIMFRKTNENNSANNSSIETMYVQHGTKVLVACGALNTIKLLRDSKIVPNNTLGTNIYDHFVGRITFDNDKIIGVNLDVQPTRDIWLQNNIGWYTQFGPMLTAYQENIEFFFSPSNIDGKGTLYYLLMTPQDPVSGTLNTKTDGTLFWDGKNGGSPSPTDKDHLMSAGEAMAIILRDNADFKNVLVHDTFSKGNHWCGGCNGIINKDTFLVLGTKNLYIIDSSIYPNTLFTHPWLTNTAMAHYVTNQIIKQDPTQNIYTLPTQYYFGRDKIVVIKNNDLNTKKTIPLTGTVTWACVIPNIGIVMANEAEHTINFWVAGKNVPTQTISLLPLEGPVGCVYDALNDEICVCCFGKNNSSGVVRLGFYYKHDRTSLKIIKTVVFEANHHLHNVYIIAVNGKQTVVVLDLGNPFISSPISGGLYKFIDDTFQVIHVNGADVVSFHPRSLVQQDSNRLYIGNQNPMGKASTLMAIDQSRGEFTLVSTCELPTRIGGDGLADVFLGHMVGTLFVTERTGGNGKLYFYNFDGQFNLLLAFDLGNTPRYTAPNSKGSIVSCSSNEGKIKTFTNLLNDTYYYKDEAPIITDIMLEKISFYLETDVLDVTT